MNSKTILIAASVALSMINANHLVRAETTRPNILWLSAEDISAHLGCYDDPHAITPHLDRLATEGARYTHAYTTAGVCAPCRSGIITGLYQTSLGTHHMRCTAKLPNHIRPFPAYLRESGYYCSNNSKQDYQFRTPADTWDDSSRTAHWRNRTNDDRPFFSVFNFTGCHESGIASTQKYRSVTQNLTASQRQDPATLTTLPPYYADTTTIRDDWKRNYELITAMDAWAGKLIQQLKEDGLYENTIIFYWSDHGVGLPRAKRWLYESGTHIPLIVRIPEQFRRADAIATGQAQPGAVLDQLVSSIDFGPTVLNLAGVAIPNYVQGQPFLGSNLPEPREYVYGARDRMDERYDIIRMVRDKRFRYIRNYEPLKTFYQYMNTPEKGAIMAAIRTAGVAGMPPEGQHIVASEKPAEALYDIASDPHELTNLATDDGHAETLIEMRNALASWTDRVMDTGLIPETVLRQWESDADASIYDVMRKEDVDVALIRKTATETTNVTDLLRLIGNENAAVRYWAAVTIGNRAEGLKQPRDGSVKIKTELEHALNDSTPAVQIAVARALLRMGESTIALPVLISSLEHHDEWVRLYAAQILDEAGEQGRSAIPFMHKALGDTNKYVVRVVNHALNALEETEREVP